MDVVSIFGGCINFLCLAYFPTKFSEFGHTAGKANAGIARVQAGPERAQARLEKARCVVKGPTSHF